MVADADVLVVGGGPTGLTTAVTLRLLGHSVVLIDPSQDKGVGSKALTIHAGTLSVLERIGCAGRVLGEGIKMKGLRLRTRRSLLLDQRLDRLPGKYRFSIALPQPQTEAILHARAVELGVDFVTGTVEKLTQDDFSASLSLRDGTIKTARYVVGADGTHSATRGALGIAFPDTGANRGDDEIIALADAALSGNVDLDHACGFPGPRGLLMVMPMACGRARLAVSLGPTETAETREEWQAFVDQRGPRGINVGEIASISRFKFRHHLADTFRQGRVLLAGDAAHVHSPVGGQGMNLGIRDAFYAAAAIDKAMSSNSETPLDAYAANRREAARAVISMTNRMSRMLFAPAPAQPIRNLILRIVSRSPLAARQALSLSGVLDTGPR